MGTAEWSSASNAETVSKSSDGEEEGEVRGGSKSGSAVGAAVTTAGVSEGAAASPLWSSEASSRALRARARGRKVGKLPRLAMTWAGRHTGRRVHGQARTALACVRVRARACVRAPSARLVVSCFGWAQSSVQ